jgi:hypothetical protein
MNIFEIIIMNVFPCRASDKCQREKRKTINGEDLLWAMSTLGFEEYVEPLKVYLMKYREVWNLLSLLLLLLSFTYSSLFQYLPYFYFIDGRR